MHVLVSGSTGLVGRALVAHLERSGNTVTPLVRPETDAAGVERGVGEPVEPLAGESEVGPDIRRPGAQALVERDAGRVPVEHAPFAAGAAAVHRQAGEGLQQLGVNISRKGFIEVDDHFRANPEAMTDLLRRWGARGADNIGRGEWVRLGPNAAHLGHMPDGYRQIFMLSVIDEYTHQEIGELLDLYRARGVLDSTYVLLVSDHGHTPRPEDERHALEAGTDVRPLFDSLGLRLRPEGVGSDGQARYDAVLA